MWLTLPNTLGIYVIVMDVVIVQEKPPHWTLATCIPTKYHCCALNQCNRDQESVGGVGISLDAPFSPFYNYFCPLRKV